MVDIRLRAKLLNINVLTFLRKLPKDYINFNIISQLVRSSSSVGANYRASAQAKSAKDFRNKLRIVAE